jgi:hypothetical protein
MESFRISAPGLRPVRRPATDGDTVEGEPELARDSLLGASRPYGLPPVRRDAGGAANGVNPVVYRARRRDPVRIGLAASAAYVG